MWWSAVRTEVRNSGASRVLPSMLEEPLVRSVLDRYKLENPTLALSENKKQLITSVLCRIPEEAVMVFCAHLDRRLWKRSALNQSILGSKELQVGFVPSGSVGLWQTLLRNTIDVCKEIARLLVRSFEQRLGDREATARRQEVLAAGPKEQELLTFQAAASLYLNWLVPEVKDKEPWAEDLLPKLWEENILNVTYGLVHDLYRISQSKVNGPFAANMTYHGVATLMGALRGQKAFVGPVSGEQKRRIAEAKRSSSPHFSSECMTSSMPSSTLWAQRAGSSWWPPWTGWTRSLPTASSTAQSARSSAARTCASSALTAT